MHADLEGLDAVRAAFDGAAGAFVMTTRDGPDDPKREVAHGRTIAAAATRVRLPFLVYSRADGS